MNNKNLVKGTLLLLGILGIIFTSKTSASAEIITGMDGTIVTLTVCGHDYNSDTDGCITMMDRNLGADAYMGEDGKTADDWNGYYYQWGDNTLYTDTDWSSSNIKFDNARGGGSDNELKYPINNDSERRGPCPEGYHVPSQGEWYALMDIYFEKAVNGSGFHKDIGRFSQAFKIPFAGRRYIDDSIQEFQYGIGYLWLSSSILGSEESWSFYMDPGVNTSKMSISANNRAYGFPVRCFKNPEPVLLSTINDFTTTTLGGNAPVTGLPETIIVTQNTISIAEGKEVLGEVNVNFGSNQTATFSHPVQVKIPVSSYEQVYVKVKHGGSSEYGFDGLTTNSNASCNNGNVVEISNRYNGETISVVDGYATIYSCSASSFIALGVENEGDSEIIVNIAKFNDGQNTCSGSNYIFENIVAGTNTGTHTLSGVFQCAFGNGRSSSTVTLQLSGDLVADGDRVISGSNLMMKNSEWTVSPVGLKFANTLISTWSALTATQTLFQKTANLIGVASGVVEVQLIVPGGTPDGLYEGTLVLTY